MQTSCTTSLLTPTLAPPPEKVLERGRADRNTTQLTKNLPHSPHTPHPDPDRGVLLLPPSPLPLTPFIYLLPAHPPLPFPSPPRHSPPPSSPLSDPTGPTTAIPDHVQAALPGAMNDACRAGVTSTRWR